MLKDANTDSFSAVIPPPRSRVSSGKAMDTFCYTSVSKVADSPGPELLPIFGILRLNSFVG